jgi:hypothetical protein
MEKLLKYSFGIFLLSTIFLCNSAFALNIDTFDDWGPFGGPFTDSYKFFEVKDGGLSDWDIGKRDGDQRIDTTNLGDIVSGAPNSFYFYYLPHTGQLNLGISFKDANDNTQQSLKTWNYANTGGFTDIYLLAKARQGQTEISNLGLVNWGTNDSYGDINSSLIANSSDNLSGFHFSGQIFDRFLLFGDFTFENSASNSDTEFFVGVANTTVPEPTTVLLIGIGLVGLAGIRKKRIKK